MFLHPIFVHFPIALLTLYSFVEVISVKKIQNLPYVFYVKAVLVITGFLGTLAAISTGEGGGREADGVRGVLGMHQTFASVTAVIFGILAGVYLVMWISKSEWNTKLMNSKVAKLWNLKLTIASWIFNNRFLLVLLSVAGLISITITGALGGIMVYGPDVDPVAKIVYDLFLK